jgi:hypothetical protein
MENAVARITLAGSDDDLTAEVAAAAIDATFRRLAEQRMPIAGS